MSFSRADSSKLTASAVLLVIEDDGLAELLADALTEAGHAVEIADGLNRLTAALARRAFAAAIVDFDIRTRNAPVLVAQVRRSAPATKVIALLPCGGSGDRSPAQYHLGIEKPARLSAIVAAVATGASLVCN